MTAELLFSFLLFFQVQIESIKESGFYKMLSEKYPAIAKDISDPKQMDKEVQEIIEVTGLNFDDLAQFTITVEGLDGISKASQEGRSPKIGSELDFFFSAKVKGDLDAMKMFAFLLDKISEEKGEDFRKKVEGSITKKEKSSSITLPSELLDQVFSDTDLRISISKDGNYSQVQLGLPDKMEAAQAAIDSNASLACVNAMDKDRQITLGIKVDPAVWERPEFNSQQQNPLFAGLANSVKGIREFGLSVSFREESLGVEVCVNCKDTQSALGLWTVAQGGLGMAQLAMAQEGGQAPSILSRIKTQAVERNVFVRVDILEEDLNEFERMSLLPQQSESAGSKGAPGDSDPMVGKAAPPVRTKLLDGTSFNLAEHKGKVVVLDFWATWCGPCVRALPELMENMSGFSSKEAMLVAVNQGESKKVISQFLKNKKLTDLTVGMDKNQKIGRDYQVQGIPKTVVIDSKGVVRHVHVGFSSGMGERLKSEIQALLKE